MSLEALVFDVDGTLADTEEAHRQAFNAAFREHGLDWVWSPERYHELLAVGGGRERMRHHLASLALAADEAAAVEERIPLVHESKTRHYTARVEAGGVPLRPGVARLIGEAWAAGLRLAIATTTSPANVEALLRANLDSEGPARFEVIAAGDAVPRKKPASDVYDLVLERLGLDAERCVAVEDSEPGLRAARGAGLVTVVTPTRWSHGHDLSRADLVLPHLGDAETPLPPADAARVGAPWLGPEQLRALLASARAAGLRGGREAS